MAHFNCLQFRNYFMPREKNNNLRSHHFFSKISMSLRIFVLYVFFLKILFALKKATTEYMEQMRYNYTDYQISYNKIRESTL